MCSSRHIYRGKEKHFDLVMLTGLKSCKNVLHSACVQPAALQSASVLCFSSVHSLRSSQEVNTTIAQGETLNMNHISHVCFTYSPDNS